MFDCCENLIIAVLYLVLRKPTGQEPAKSGKLYQVYVHVDEKDLRA